VEEMRILLGVEGKNIADCTMPRGGCFSRNGSDMERYIDAKLESKL